MSVSIDLTEVHHLSADLLAQSADIEGKATTALDAGGARIASTARTTVAANSYFTGELLGAIAVHTGSLSVNVEAGTDHAVFVEQGTSHMPAEPFLGPAFDQHLEGTVNDLADAGSDFL